ncbi:hypothetical protein ACIRRH_43370 [Kitasatospora sp. NPDC101235]|uniref:hypothetical protein n=1 Tax=Kitasatospora sp. NPDC101235 TaxID=3364101 RepID=UPI0038245449
MTIRRTALITAATVLALSAVAACNNGDDAQSAPPAASSSPAASATASVSSTPSPTATTAAPTPTATVAPTPTATGAPVDASGAFDPAVALANPDLTPYAATETMKTTATAGGQGSVIVQTGRINFNTPTRECRIETKMMVGDESDEPTIWMESISTGTATFLRNKGKSGSAWSQSDTDSGDDADPSAYAKALVKAGPAARKGMEQKNGVPAYHLGARLTAAQIQAIDPKNYGRMVDQGVTAQDHDVWIDSFGRILAQAQSMKVPKGGTTVTSTITVTYTDFGPRETFADPTIAAG